MAFRDLEKFIEMHLKDDLPLPKPGFPAPEGVRPGCDTGEFQAALPKSGERGFLPDLIWALAAKRDTLKDLDPTTLPRDNR